MMKMKSAAVALSALLLGSGVAYADFVDGFVGGVVGGVVGSVVTNEVYRHNGRRRRTVRKHRRRVVRHRRRTVHKKPKTKVVVKKVYVAQKAVKKTPLMSPEKKIQKALSSLGFYHGPIDGQINGYESRSAIKAMNNAYERGNTATMDGNTRDTLIYLGDLFTFDKNLVAQGSDSRTKGKKIQTALKIEGAYHDKIDGAVGPATRRAISEYTGGSSSLDYESEYRLIEDAKKKNDASIEEAINSLKGHKVSKGMQKIQTNGSNNNDTVILQPSN